MWKPEHRATADRRGLRYESDLTEAEWALVAPLIRPAKCGGRRRTVNVREVLNAIFYVLWAGCQWKALPKALPHAAFWARTTVAKELIVLAITVWAVTSRRQSFPAASPSNRNRDRRQAGSSQMAPQPVGALSHL